MLNPGYSDDKFNISIVTRNNVELADTCCYPINNKLKQALNKAKELNYKLIDTLVVLFIEEVRTEECAIQQIEPNDH